MKSLRCQIMLETDKSHTTIQIFDASPNSVKVEENIQCMISTVGDSSCLALVTEQRNLQSICGQLATAEQEHDLTGFWEIGKRMFLNRIEYFILKTPSAQVPQRRAKLLTFKKKMKQLEREDNCC